VTLVFFVAYIVHMLMMLTCFKCRQKVLSVMGESSTDDEDDEASQQQHRWNEEAAEGLLEAGALMLAFLSMRLLKYEITGKFEDPLEEANQPRKPLYIIIMLVVTCAWLVSIVLVNCYCGSDDVEDEDPVVLDLGFRWLQVRSLQLLGKFACFTAALGMLTTIQWFLDLLLDRTGMAPTGRKYLTETADALITTALAYTMIWCIGKVDEILASAKSFAGLEATEDLLTTAGFMVGFAWEHVYRESIEAISAYGSEQLDQKEHSVNYLDLVLTFCILTFVLPSLYLHINPQARRSTRVAKKTFRQMFEEQTDEEEEKGMSQQS